MQVITQTADLAALCERLSAETFVTVDTEFMRDRTFWPKLCSSSVTQSLRPAASIRCANLA